MDRSIRSLFDSNRIARITLNPARVTYHVDMRASSPSRRAAHLDPMLHVIRIGRQRKVRGGYDLVESAEARNGRPDEKPSTEVPSGSPLDPRTFRNHNPKHLDPMATSRYAPKLRWLHEPLHERQTRVCKCRFCVARNDMHSVRTCSSSKTLRKSDSPAAMGVPTAVWASHRDREAKRLLLPRLPIRTEAVAWAWRPKPRARPPRRRINASRTDCARPVINCHEKLLIIKP